MRYLSLAFWITIAFVLGIFVTANPGVMSISMAPLPWGLESPLWLFVVCVFTAGVLVGRISALYASLRLRLMLRRSSRRIVALEEECRAHTIEQLNPLLPRSTETTAHDTSR